MLREYIEKIELSLDSDVIVFFGLIEPNLINILIESIQKIRPKRKKLTLIVHTVGGELSPIKELNDKVFSADIYEEIWMIANNKMYSAGTMLSFFADKLYAISQPFGDATEFGMIDPQLEYNNPIFNSKEYVSAFIHLECYNVKANLHDIDKLDGSFTYDLQGNFEAPIVKQALKEIYSVREMAFNALVKHNLKNDPDKEQKAIKLINSLMISDKYKHNSIILDRNIQEMGLKIYHSEEINTALVYVENYTERVMKYFHPYNGGVAYGNNLRCLIQSKDEIIY